MLFYFACEAAGASSARHSLRPLIFRCANLPAKLGRIAPRDRGGVAVRQLTRESAVVMAGLVPAIHVFLAVTKPGRGSPGHRREAKLRRLPGDDAVVVAGYSPSLRGATRRSN